MIIQGPRRINKGEWRFRIVRMRAFQITLSAAGKPTFYTCPRRMMAIYNHRVLVVPGYSRSASSLTEGTSSALDTGQPSLALLAISWNFSCSIPFTLPLVLSKISLMAKPSAVLVRETSAEVCIFSSWQSKKFGSQKTAPVVSYFQTSVRRHLRSLVSCCIIRGCQQRHVRRKKQGGRGREPFGSDQIYRLAARLNQLTRVCPKIRQTTGEIRIHLLCGLPGAEKVTHNMAPE